MKFEVFQNIVTYKMSGLRALLESVRHPSTVLLVFTPDMARQEEDKWIEVDRAKETPTLKSQTWCPCESLSPSLPGTVVWDLV